MGSNLLSQMNTLFNFVPPDELRKSLVSIFFKALDATED